MTAEVLRATRTLEWVGDCHGHLELLDQTRLPLELEQVECRDVESVWEAIRALRVRGAPAIGIAAAYGVCLGIAGPPDEDRARLDERFHTAVRHLASSRPTAVNLFWALNRLERVAAGIPAGASADEYRERILAEAHAIADEDRKMCRAIGAHGEGLLQNGQGVLTHCNAGGLATADYGTALALFFAAHEAGKTLHVFVDETRPLLQGARLTAWELLHRGVSATLICDSMAAQVMREGKVQAVVTGADRIAANGDTANKIGTYGLAVLARAHRIPFYVAAPTSTFDFSLANGSLIPIEQRDAREITHGFGRQTAPDGVAVYNPAFDVTPAELITAIVCERGLVQPVTAERLAAVAGVPSPGTGPS